MRELSLFTGAGGGILGTKLLGWTPIGYVEIDEHCQKSLRQRQEDGYIERAPIFSDIRTFISEGYAERYRGMVDVITVGFPCQPFSVAGRQTGADDPRNMWPSTIKCIDIIRPQTALLENVPGLLTTWQRLLVRLIPNNTGWLRRFAVKVCYPSYFGRILGDLAEIGYDAKWGLLAADDVGAWHGRKRLWILAYPNSQREQ